MNSRPLDTSNTYLSYQLDAISVLTKVVHELFWQSSDEEEYVGEDCEMKRKKKGLKDKIKDKISGDKEAPEQQPNITSIPPENPEEKKGFLDKIKEKLPGQHKKAEDGANEGYHHPAAADQGDHPKEKGILEKIKEKIPGCNGHKAEQDKPKEISS